MFNWLQTAGNVSRHEMYRTFNCGVGMIIALPEAEVENALALLNANGEKAWKIGVIKASDANNVWLLLDEYCGAYFRQRKQFAGNHRCLQSQ